MSTPLNPIVLGLTGHYDIITHDGVFHADEIVAICIIGLSKLGSATIPLQVGRTRDKDIITKAKDDGKIIIDVGGEYNSSNLFDHHQSNELASSAGLVWKTYGHMAIWNITKRMGIATISLPDDAVDHIFQKVETEIINAIDAIDTGRANLTVGQIPSLSLSAIITSYNDDNAYSATEQGLAFLAAIEFTWELLYRIIRRHVLAEAYAATVLKAKDEALARQEWAMVLPEAGSWLSAVQGHWDDFMDILLVIYPSGNEWRIQTLPSDPNDPQSMRCPAPMKGRGLRDDELNEVTKLKNGVFIHANGFIGGAKTQEDARLLAYWWIVNQQAE